MANVPLIMVYRSLGVAKGMSPYKTGNWRHNAIHLKNVRDKSFTIHYSGSDAHYMHFVEEGTKYIKARHTIRDTAMVLGTMFQNYYNGKNTNHNGLVNRAVATSRNTEERALQHHISMIASTFDTE